jgi:hypothetical protein
VKRDLLCLHLFNQLFDSIKGCLICEPGRQATIMLNLLVDLNALLTHSQFRNRFSYLAVSYKTKKPRFVHSPKGTTPKIKKDHSTSRGMERDYLHLCWPN